MSVGEEDHVANTTRLESEGIASPCSPVPIVLLTVLVESIYNAIYATVLCEVRIYATVGISLG